MKSFSALLMAVVATLFALTSLVEVTQAAPPHDAGWKIRGSRDSSYSTRRFSGPVYRSYSAPEQAETARDAETERRSFSVEPEAKQPGHAAPAAPQGPSAQVPQARRTYSYEPAPTPVYREYPSRSRGSSKPEWSKQKMLRNN